MSRRPEVGTLILGLLGGMLLVYLTLPLAYLFFQIDWREVPRSLADPRAVRAVEVSLVFVPMVLPPLVGGILLLLLYGPSALAALVSSASSLPSIALEPSLTEMSGTLQ